MKPYNLTSISYYFGHLKGNYALIPINPDTYYSQTRPLPPYILRALKASSASRIWALWFLRIYPGANMLTWPLIRLTSYWVWLTEQWARRIPVRSLRYTSLSRAPDSWIYCSSRTPNLAKDVLALESVQRRASWLALGQKLGEMEYEDGLRKLKWPTLETRRLFLSLVECYKIVFGKNKLNFDDLCELTKCNSTRANHPYKPYVKPASVPIRIVRDWNSLPGSIVEAGNLNRFKSALKRFLKIH